MSEEKEAKRRYLSKEKEAKSKRRWGREGKRREGCRDGKGN